MSARGVWSENEKTIFAVRVTHPNAASHRSKSLKQLYRENENEKKRMYNDRVINCERATFTTLVFTNTGRMGPEWQIQQKNGGTYSGKEERILQRCDRSHSNKITVCAFTEYTCGIA